MNMAFFVDGSMLNKTKNGLYSNWSTSMWKDIWICFWLSCSSDSSSLIKCFVFHFFFSFAWNILNALIPTLNTIIKNTTSVILNYCSTFREEICINQTRKVIWWQRLSVKWNRIICSVNNCFVLWLLERSGCVQLMRDLLTYSPWLRPDLSKVLQNRWLCDSTSTFPYKLPRRVVIFSNTWVTVWLVKRSTCIWRLLCIILFSHFSLTVPDDTPIGDKGLH